MNKLPLLSLLSPLWSKLNQQPWMRPLLVVLAATAYATERLAPPPTVAHQLARELQGLLLILASGSVGTSHLTPSPEPRPEPRTDEEAAAVLRDILKSVLILALAGAVLLALLAPRSVMAQEKGVYVVKAAQVITVDGTMHEVTQGAYFTPAAHLAVAKETVRLQDENRVLKSERVSPVAEAVPCRSWRAQPSPPWLLRARRACALRH